MPGASDSPKSSEARTFPHIMLREIYEQPSAIRETIQKNVRDDTLFPRTLQAMEPALLAFKKIIVTHEALSQLAERTSKQ